MSTIYHEFIVEKRDGYDLIIFLNVRDDWFTDKNITVDEFKTAELETFIYDYAKKKDIGLYFHHEHGPAYGAGYKYYKDNTLVIKHEEYWLNGYRIIEQEQIDLIKNKGGNDV